MLAADVGGGKEKRARAPITSTALLSFFQPPWVMLPERQKPKHFHFVAFVARKPFPCRKS
jgi:hypothetical protein